MISFLLSSDVSIFRPLTFPREETRDDSAAPARLFSHFQKEFLRYFRIFKPFVFVFNASYICSIYKDRRRMQICGNWPEIRAT